jgi:hypothetical protein
MLQCRYSICSFADAIMGSAVFMQVLVDEGDTPGLCSNILCSI